MWVYTKHPTTAVLSRRAIATAVNSRPFKSTHYRAATRFLVPMAGRRDNPKTLFPDARKGIAAVAAGILIAAVVAPAAAGASVIRITSSPTTSASIGACTNVVSSFINCTSTAFTSFNDATLTSPFIPGAFNGQPPTTQNFQSAFNTWLKDCEFEGCAQFTGGSAPGGVTWNIVNGGVLNNVTLTINEFTAFAGVRRGGINPIVVSIILGSGYTGPPLEQLVWTQALYTNDSPTNPFGAPYFAPPLNTLDTYTFAGGNDGGVNQFGMPCTALETAPANSNNVTVAIGATPAGTAYCDPIYPFQSVGELFGDAPQLGWPSASFDAIALLSTLSETTNAADQVTAATLTVYDGIEYGFDLTAVVPEPGSITLLLSGLSALWGVRRLRAPSPLRAGLNSDKYRQRC